MNEIFDKIKEKVEAELSCSAHDMDHVMRVYNLALHLAETEDVDLDVIKAAALLHDIARVKEDDDPTGKINHAILSAEMASPILKEVGFPEEKISHVQDCIVSHRYKTDNKPKTKEAQLVFDSDKLDAIGAIGMAREFVWVGRNNANIYIENPDIPKYIEDNLGGKINGRIQDSSKHSPQIEYQIKIKFILDKLYTDRAKQVGQERMKYLKDFLDRLEGEIKGEL